MRLEVNNLLNKVVCHQFTYGLLTILLSDAVQNA